MPARPVLRLALPSRPLPLLRAAALALLLPLPATAQGTPDWALGIAGDLLARAVLNEVEEILRARPDVSWGAIEVEAATGGLVLRDVVVAPALIYDTAGACRIAASRATLRPVPSDRPGAIALQLVAEGASAPLDCLPVSARATIRSAGQERLDMPLFTADLDYAPATTATRMIADATVTGLAGATLSADFAELSVSPDGDPPTGALRGAALTLRDAGGWAVLAPLLPGAARDPETAGATLGAVVRLGLGFVAEGAPLSEQGVAMADSVTAAWPRFLADPQGLSLRTTFDPATPRALRLEAWGADPAVLIDDLAPRLETAPVTMPPR